MVLKWLQLLHVMYKERGGDIKGPAQTIVTAHYPSSESPELGGCGAQGKSEIVLLLLPFCISSYPLSSPWVKCDSKECVS